MVKKCLFRVNPKKTNKLNVSITISNAYESPYVEKFTLLTTKCIPLLRNYLFFG